MTSEESDYSSMGTGLVRPYRTMLKSSRHFTQYTEDKQNTDTQGWMDGGGGLRESCGDWDWKTARDSEFLMSWEVGLGVERRPTDVDLSGARIWCDEEAVQLRSGPVGVC